MSERTEKRRLAALMLTDIVGYTALTQRNERLALTLLEEHNDILQQFFTEYSGREIKMTGDGFLVEFLSALDAVNCAVGIQTNLKARNDSDPTGVPLHIRIGIHVGDVVHRGNDIFGDGVNITSRIEPLAMPGGIALSQHAYAQVWNKTELQLVSMGKKHLKNIDVPIEIFQLELPWQTEAGPGSRPSVMPAAGSDVRTRRRIAVLPFDNISSDPQDAYLADGLTEELIFTLSKIRDLRVIAKTSVMRYRALDADVTEIGTELNVGTILEGSVRKAGNRVRITTQLIDVGTQEHLWSEAYDRKLGNLFDLQREIAERVAYALRVQLMAEEKREINREPTRNQEAHMLYLRGRYAWNQWTEDALWNAIDYFERAAAVDAKYGLAYAGIADTYSLLAHLGYLSPEEAYPKAKETAEKALAIDSSLAEAHSSLAMISIVFDGDLDGAEKILQHAIELNPNCATAHHWYALVLRATGREKESWRASQRALELDPLAPVFNAAVGQLLATNRAAD